VFGSVTGELVIVQAAPDGKPEEQLNATDPLYVGSGVTVMV
jgi:hypothetical protein